MYNQGNLAVAEQQTQQQEQQMEQQEQHAIMFRFPEADISTEFTPEDMAEDVDGIRISFPRAKISGGGSTMFELPTEDPAKPKYVESIRGVILYHHAANGYWVGDVTDEDNAPLCTSMDGKQGYGEPGGLCVSCALNRFGSGEDGKAKACKNQRYLYLLQDGEMIPLELHLPPTSLKAFSRFVNVAFVYRKRPSYGSEVELTLHREEKPTPHAVVDFRKIRDFSGEELKRAIAFRNAFCDQTKLLLKERIKEIIAQKQDSGTYSDLQGGDSGSFVIEGGELADGERGELPL